MNGMVSSFKRYISMIIVFIFNCLPIKTNKIFLFSYYGAQYGCNPKYITEYILRNYPRDKFDLVWAFNDIESKEGIEGIRKVRTMSLRYFYELCTSKVIITNYRTTDLFVKRKNQYYIQTWHSSLRLKQIEKDAESSLTKDYVQMAKKDSGKCDLLLSGCRYSTEIFRRCFWYGGQIFEHGTLRNDIFFRNDHLIRREILDKLNIPCNSKIVLYAPTFRKDDSLEVYNLNYSLIMKKLNSKFGGDWFFIVRLHPHLLSKSSQLAFGENVIDVTKYDDIQELLSISDILISDYSSVIFDFSLTRRPCFLYIPDVADYVKNDRQLYFDITQLPFVCAVSNKDLLNKIETFDNEEYQNNLSGFLNNIGSFEKGTACKSLLQQIDRVCFS